MAKLVSWNNKLSICYFKLIICENKLIIWNNKLIICYYKLGKETAAALICFRTIFTIKLNRFIALHKIAVGHERSVEISQVVTNVSIWVKNSCMEWKTTRNNQVITKKNYDGEFSTLLTLQKIRHRHSNFKKVHLPPPPNVCHVGWILGSGDNFVPR